MFNSIEEVVSPIQILSRVQNSRCSRYKMIAKMIAKISRLWMRHYVRHCKMPTRDTQVILAHGCDVSNWLDHLSCKFYILLPSTLLHAETTIWHPQKAATSLDICRSNPPAAYPSLLVRSRILSKTPSDDCCHMTACRNLSPKYTNVFVECGKIECKTNVVFVRGVGRWDIAQYVITYGHIRVNLMLW